MSDCLSAGLASHNFKGFHTQRCIDCNLRLADFVAWSIAEAIRADRAKLKSAFRKGIPENAQGVVFSLYGIDAIFNTTPIGDENNG